MDWTKFSNHGESNNHAFEVMCNLLFENWCHEEYGESIERFSFVNGSGGDGGVEAFCILDSGEIIGVQSKWFPEKVEGSQITQIKNSFKTAMKIRPNIVKYIVCVPVFNLWEGLLDTRVKMPTGEYGLFRLVEDYGIRWLSYGNGSGGHFFGPYRSFIVEADGNTEFYSLGVSSYWKDGWESQGKNPKTCICVAHDDEETSHHALQLVVEDNSVVNGDVVVFYHHGRIAIGRMGSGKKSDLMSMVKRRYPKIIDGNRYCLGSIKNDHLLRLDEPDVIELVVNLISYSIVRDEYRKKSEGGKALETHRLAQAGKEQREVLASVNVFLFIRSCNEQKSV